MRLPWPQSPQVHPQSPQSPLPMPPAFAGYHSSGLPFGTPFTPVLGRSPGTFGFTSISPGADQNASTSSLGAGTSGEAQEDLEDQVRALRQENACLQPSVDKLKRRPPRGATRHLL